MPETGEDCWAPVARDSRDALALLGYQIGPRCLPGEPGACGGSFAEHAFAHLTAIRAVADHQLAHLKASPACIAEIYEAVTAGLEAGDARG